MLSWAPNLHGLGSRLRNRGFDEVILLNGRRTRVRMVHIRERIRRAGKRGGTPPPVSEGCLPGITREVLLEEIQVKGVKVSERPLTVRDLERADEVFITSTTRGLLPVKEIAGRALESRGDICIRLVSAFNSYVGSEIARRKNATVAV